MIETKTKTVCLSGKVWKLPEVLQLGGGLTGSNYFYEVVGYRPPLKGDLYISGAVPALYKARNDLPFCNHLIARTTALAKQKTIWYQSDESL